MAKLKPWFHVVQPREDLRTARPLDASEFAVNLDLIREGKAPQDYQDPRRFFERTYLTKSLKELAAQTVRRLSGIMVETSPVFNMATQFGGGKTHSLGLLYHLARGGSDAEGWQGVSDILQHAQVKAVPGAATAIFVGQKFDTMTGRGGTDGTPLRKTPWGEIAWQLGGEKSFAVVARHDDEGIAPGGDTIRDFLPDGPALILLDELVNYMSRYRQKGLSYQLLNFLQNLSEEVRSRSNVVLAVSIPSSDLTEIMPEDQRDHEALKKMLDRVGKSVIISNESDHAEIIRRRLFEWTDLPDEGKKTAAAYADWVLDHRSSFGSFDVSSARERFQATYPFHPALISVFERKWQSLPRFQKTRGVLRLLALWVSHAYEQGYKGAHRDPLIGLGTAPLEDPYFRAALFDQLGNNELEGPVTTDIAGKMEANAIRLDRDAKDDVKKARLHQKVATVILFESNGGQSKAVATVPEIRLAVSEPDLDIASIESILEALTPQCHYLSSDKNCYYFSLNPNLNKLHAERMRLITQNAPGTIEEKSKQGVQDVFKAGPALDRIYWPEATSQVPNRAALTLVVLAPRQSAGDSGTRSFIEDVVRNHGTSGRTCKSALLFAVPENNANLQVEAHKLVAWEDIQDDKETLDRLDDKQKRELKSKCEEGSRHLKEAVWRAYNHVFLLGKGDALRDILLGQINSSAAGSLVELYLNRLREQDEITDSVGPNKLLNAWPVGMDEWTTRAARDAFFSSPTLPRLLNPNAIKRTIADAVNQGRMAYASKVGDQYEPLHFKPEVGLTEHDIEISEDEVLLTVARAKQLIQPPRLSRCQIQPSVLALKPGEAGGFTVACFDQHGHAYPCPNVVWTADGGTIDATGQFVAEAVGNFTVRGTVESLQSTAQVRVATGPPPLPPSKGISWRGGVTPQKWMNFYTKVLSRFAATPGLTLEVRFKVAPGEGVTDSKLEETRAALRELGLKDELDSAD